MLNISITWTKNDRHWLIEMTPLMPLGAKLNRTLRLQGNMAHVRVILVVKSGMVMVMKLTV